MARAEPAKQAILRRYGIFAALLLAPAKAYRRGVQISSWRIAAPAGRAEETARTITAERGAVCNYGIRLAGWRYCGICSAGYGRITAQAAVADRYYMMLVGYCKVRRLSERR